MMIINFKTQITKTDLTLTSTNLLQEDSKGSNKKENNANHNSRINQISMSVYENIRSNESQQKEDHKQY